MLGQLLDVALDVPRFFALKLWRWVARAHTAVDVGPPHYAGCRMCSKPWPCQEWVTATDHIANLRRVS